MSDAPPAVWEVYADVMLQRAALSVRLLRGEPPRPLAGLVIDDDEIDALLNELPGLRAPTAASTEAALAAQRDDVDVVESQLDAVLAGDPSAAADGEVDPFVAIAHNAALDGSSARLLATALAIEIDPARQLLIAYINDDASRRWLTPMSIERVLGGAGAAALAADAPLARTCLVNREDADRWSSMGVRPAAGLAAAIVGAGGAESNLPRDARLVEADDATGGQFVVVHGADPVTRERRAASLTSGRRFIVVPIPTDDRRWEAVVRQCTIGGLSAIVELGRATSLTEDQRWWIDRATHLPMALCSAAEIKLDSLPHRPFVEYAAPADLGGVGGGHLLDATQAELAHRVVRSFDGDWDAAVRRLVTGRLDSHAVRTRPGWQWDDLVLPDDHIAILRELVARYRHRRRVYRDWGFPARPSTGVTTLFAGPSGTGKTMTAEVIAASLGLDLYRVDLSAVVSKYIGETEQNLEEIFTASSAGNLVLFFDEADALFGKRTEVSDAHDRYANIEVAYLLQRLERYDGFVILATNLRNNIDAAFLRRIDLALEFDIPDVEQRRAIWERAFPETAPVGAIDIDALAEEFDITGGVIRNAVVHAAFLAADADSSIEMEHVVLGLRRELQKLGRLRALDGFDRRRETARAASAR